MNNEEGAERLAEKNAGSHKVGTKIQIIVFINSIVWYL